MVRLVLLALCACAFAGVVSSWRGWTRRAHDADVRRRRNRLVIQLISGGGSSGGSSGEAGANSGGGESGGDSGGSGGGGDSGGERGGEREGAAVAAARATASVSMGDGSGDPPSVEAEVEVVPPRRSRSDDAGSSVSVTGTWNANGRTLIPRRVCEAVRGARGGRVPMDVLAHANAGNDYVVGKLAGLTGMHRETGLRVTGAVKGAALPTLRETIEAVARERDAAGLPPTTILQVGANEGATDNDPVFHIAKAGRHRLRGVLVEPVPELFEKLKHNYQDVPGEWIFEQALVGDEDGARVPFYYLRPSELEAWCAAHNQTVPWWGSQLGSASEDTIMALARNAVWRPVGRCRSTLSNPR
jgi:FkbM family methyltransferase